MIVNKDILRKETMATLTSVEIVIDDIKQQAQDYGITPEKMRDANNNYVMAPLLLAKINALDILVQLQAK
jgi:hypothetical protein